jgi:hypothetical protein
VPRAAVAFAIGALLISAVTACGTIPQRPTRLEPSSYGCMTAVLRQRLPANLPDKRAHCLASGLIARYCSLPEAYLAGIGKEVRDLLGGGDAEWADWRADRVGIACSHRAADDDGLVACCELQISGRIAPLLQSESRR